MKAAFKGFLLGITLTSLVSIGFAYGLDEVKDMGATDLIAHINKIITSQCQVNVGYGRITPGYRCRQGEVMTGVLASSENIYCSEVSVDCFHKD